MSLKHSNLPESPLTDSCYVSVTPTKSSIYRLLNWLSGTGEKSLEREYLNQLYSMAHVTIMYSKEKAPDPTGLVGNDAHTLSHHSYDRPLIGVITQFEEWDGHDGTGYLVAKLGSEDLNKLHEKWKAAGCEHSFPEFEAHLTIMSPYSPGLVDIQMLNDRLNEFPVGMEFVNETAVPVS